MGNRTVKTRILEGFDDPSFGARQWTDLLAKGETDTVALTWLGQRNWWENRGHGKLMLIAAERNGEVLALAPLFTDETMVFNICPEDYLDFVGDISDSEVLDAILETARACTPNFTGFRFYFVPDTSRTGARLQEAASRLNLVCYEEESLDCPALNIAAQPQAAVGAANKKKLLQYEEFFRKTGVFEVEHLRESEAVLPHLEAFFEQHQSRRAATSHPSVFLDPARRKDYEQFTRIAGAAGWLRFTRILWDGRPIAYHHGTCYRGRYVFGVPTFAIDLAKRSPGQVLLRQLILAAIQEGARTFDFGIGGEAYKYRFATEAIQLRTWALYDPACITSK